MNEFDPQAATWDADPAKVERALAVAAAIRRRLPLGPGMNALEYGCGTGLLGFALAGDLGHIVLADSSPGMLAVLQRKIAASGRTNLSALELDLTRDSPPAERFDLVCSLLVFHHIADVAGTLAIIHDLLTPGGTLALADLDTEDGSFHGPDFTGHHGFDRVALAAVVAGAGFGPAEFATVHSIVRTTPAGERAFPLFLMIASAR